jgi:hypothetical protein
MCNIKERTGLDVQGKQGMAHLLGNVFSKGVLYISMQMEVVGCDLREGEAMNEEGFCVEGGNF